MSNQKGFTIWGIIGLITLFMSGIGYYLISGGMLLLPQMGNDGFVGNFDINSSGDRMIFPYTKNGMTNIYISKIDGKDVNKIDNSQNGNWSRFSPDGKKIIFLTGSKSESWSDKFLGFKYINIINSDGSGLQKIDINKLDSTIDSVREAVVDSNGKIYFIGSVKKYPPDPKLSPLSFVLTWVPNDYFDIYSLDLGDSKISKITNQEFPILNNLHINYEKDVLYAVADRGIYGKDLSIYYKMGNSENKYIELKPPLTVRTEKEGFSGSTISFSDDELLAVYSVSPGPPYNYFSDLYYSKFENGEWKLSKKITNFNKYIHNSKVLKNNKVYFLLYTNWEGKLSGKPKFDLMEVGLDGAGIKKIELSI